MSQDSQSSNQAGQAKDQDKSSSVERWFEKLFFTAISVKVWGLVAGTSISTSLLFQGYIAGGQWAAFNTTVWGLIFGMKEIFRISKNREDSSQKLIREKADMDLKLMSMRGEQFGNTSRSTQSTNQNSVDGEGREIVGEDPS